MGSRGTGQRAAGSRPPLPKLRGSGEAQGLAVGAPANRARRMQVKRHFSWLPMQWLMQWRRRESAPGLVAGLEYLQRPGWP